MFWSSNELRWPQQRLRRLFVFLLPNVWLSALERSQDVRIRPRRVQTTRAERLREWQSPAADGMTVPVADRNAGRTRRPNVDKYSPTLFGFSRARLNATLGGRSPTDNGRPADDILCSNAGPVRRSAVSLFANRAVLWTGDCARQRECTAKRPQLHYTCTCFSIKINRNRCCVDRTRDDDGTKMET